MTRSFLKLSLAALLVPLLILGIYFFHLAKRDLITEDRITEENSAKIKLNMTLEQVEAILGTEWQWGGRMITTHWWFREWRGSNGRIVVLLNEDGLVVSGFEGPAQFIEK